MNRVVVLGSGGSGKSTFAESLAEITGLPLFHLDEYYWHPGWIVTPPDDWRVVQGELAARDRWIIEGNYSGTYDLRLSRADTVIVLSPPRRVCVYRVVRRVALNWHRAVQAAGCPERFDISFIHWVWRFPKEERPMLDQALLHYAGRFNVVELTSIARAARYLNDWRASAS